MKIRKKIIIGGEKVFPVSMFSPKNQYDIFSDYERAFKHYFLNYTFGGYHSLLAIIDDLNLNKEKDVVLLPSYLCETILKPFEKRCVKYQFYRINKDLIPDFQHIFDLINHKTKAILFIDYMGKSQIDNVLPYYNRLLSQEVKIIQDCVQTVYMGQDKIYGDYAFNSFRKLTPLEGSLIISKTKMCIRYANGNNFKFIFYKRVGQLLRGLHLRYNLLKPDLFLFFFNKAEKFYHNKKIYKFPKINKLLIKKFNVKQLRERNQNCYRGLMANFRKLTPKYLQSDDFYPFGFFMLLDNRDYTRSILYKNDVFCPIHWDIPPIVNKDSYMDSYYVSKRTITIPLYDYDESEFEYCLESLKEVLF